MAKEVRDPVKVSKAKELPKGVKRVFNKDVKIEWLDWTGLNGSKLNHKKGTTSIVNHNMADKLVSAKKAKIVEEDVEREVPKDPNPKK